MKNFDSFYLKQKGAILVAGLLLLLIITMLSITGMHSISLSEKMASNLRDHHVAFHAAESALLDGERWITRQKSRSKAVSACSNAPCDVWKKDQLGHLKGQSHAWWQANGHTFSAVLPGLSSQPNFIIEEIKFVPHELSPNSNTKGIAYYRVTARGTGIVDTSEVIMQSIYAMSFDQ